jgi:hypothetical protein
MQPRRPPKMIKNPLQDRIEEENARQMIADAAQRRIKIANDKRLLSEKRLAEAFKRRDAATKKYKDELQEKKKKTMSDGGGSKKGGGSGGAGSKR